jgi:hypothetical protein
METTTTTTTLQEIGPKQEIWLQALESGKYAQFSNFLSNNTQTAFCCLGLGCFIGIVPHYIDDQGCINVKDTDGSGSNEILIGDSFKYLGLYSPRGSHKDHGFFRYKSLEQLNDSHKTFKEIAEIIRADPSAYFKDVV